MFDSPNLEDQASELCGGDTFCLYDIAATGRVEIGLSTLQGSQEFESILELSIPGIHLPVGIHLAMHSNTKLNMSALTLSLSQLCVIHPVRMVPAWQMAHVTVPLDLKEKDVQKQVFKYIYIYRLCNQKLWGLRGLELLETT